MMSREIDAEWMRVSLTLLRNPNTCFPKLGNTPILKSLKCFTTIILSDLFEFYVQHYELKRLTIQVVVMSE